VLHELGRPEASTQADIAAFAFSELAAAKPDVYRPQLASAMRILGVTLADVRPGDAMRSALEAVTISRELSETSGRYEPDLASSLCSLAVVVSEVEPAAALPPAEEAISIYRDLAADGLGSARSWLAYALLIFSTILVKAGRPADALSPAKESAGTFRELKSGPHQHRLLPQALSNLADILDLLGKKARAEAASREATTVQRRIEHPPIEDDWISPLIITDEH
jgi:hypothetical protein